MSGRTLVRTVSPEHEVTTCAETRKWSALPCAADLPLSCVGSGDGATCLTGYVSKARGEICVAGAAPEAFSEGPTPEQIARANDIARRHAKPALGETNVATKPTPELRLPNNPRDLSDIELAQRLRRMADLSTTSDRQQLLEAADRLEARSLGDAVALATEEWL